MENLPKNVAKQWSKWGRQSNYLFSDKTINKKYYDKIVSDLTAISIADDKYAPIKAVNWMTECYENTNKKILHLKPQEFEVAKIGHFGVFNEKFKNTIWIKIVNEII